MPKKYDIYPGLGNKYLQYQIVKAMNETATIEAQEEVRIAYETDEYGWIKKWGYADIAGEVSTNIGDMTFAIELKSCTNDFKSGVGLNLLKTNFSYIVFNGYFTKSGLVNCLRYLYDKFGDNEKYIGLIYIKPIVHSWGLIAFEPVILRNATCCSLGASGEIPCKEDRISKFFINQLRYCLNGAS